MKDYKVNLEDLHDSHTLGSVRDWNTLIETKLINERFASVMDECVTLTSQPHRCSVDVQNNPFRVIFKIIRGQVPKVPDLSYF